MKIQIIKDKISPSQLSDLCAAWFGDMVKIVVDIGGQKIAIGGELHADAEALLLADGSQQSDLWGANIYPWNEPENRIEYTALINIRPHDDNPSMEIMNPQIRTKIKQLVEKLILGPDEKLV